MAAGASGQDEIIRVSVQTSVEGVRQSLDRLKDISSQLTAIDKQLRSGLNVDALNKQFAEVAKQFEKVAKAVQSGSSNSEKSIDGLSNKVRQLNNEMAKVQKSKAIGFIGSPADTASLKAYQSRLENVGHAIMGQPKDFAMAIGNIRRFRKDMNDVSKVGYATAASLRAIDGGPPAFMQPLANATKFKATLGVVRENLMAVTLQLRSQAKDMQWVGRQMLEGITVPIVGLGTMAVRSFASFQSEMIQLKKVTEFGAGKESADQFYDSLLNGTNGIREMSKEFGIGRKAATGLFREVAALGVDGEEQIKAFANAVSEVAMVGDVDTATAMQFFRTMNAIFAEGKTSSEGLAKTRDLMAQMSAVADETSLELKDLAAAFPEVAPVMQQMGFSAAGVAASLAGMYKRGIPATEAAHGLKFALQRLVSPTKDAKELIDKMGFSFFDASGNIKKADVEVMAMAKNLSAESMSAEEASKALGELFGLRQAARMKSFFDDVNIGRKELEQFSAGTLKASDLTSDYARGLVAAGFGAKNATGPMDRYNKALEEIKKDPTMGIKRLKSAFDDFKVQLGATITPALLMVGEGITKILNFFTEMPKGIQVALVAAAAFVATLAPITIILGQATHALVTMGRVALRVLPKLAPNLTPAKSAAMMVPGQSTVIQAGDKTTAVMKIRDRLRYGLGMRTSAEKAAEAAKGAIGGSALAPETTATATLTSAKQALTAASAQVAAAEAAEAAAHNGNTAAMAAQAVATNKGVFFDEKMLRWKDAVTKQTLSQADALKKMTAAQLAMYNVANRTYSAQNIKNAKDFFAATMGGGKAGTAVAGASASQIAFVEAIRAMQAKRLTQLPPPPVTPRTLIAGDTAGKTRDIFKSLWTSANATFFTPIGDAAGKAKKKIVEMAAAAKISSAGQGISGAFGATAGAFTAGRKGNLGSDAAGMAAAASLGKVGKVFGGLGKIFGKFTGVLAIGSGPIGKVLTLLLRFNKVTLILSVVAGAIAFVVMMFKGMKTNWEAVMAKIQPGIDAIKAAFERLKETFAGVFERMMGIFGQLGTGAEEGAGAASAFEGIGGVISTVFEGIASAIDFVATVIEYIWPFFERTAYIVKNTVGFIAALFKGEWSQAFMFALATVYEWVRPVLVAFDIVVKGVAQAISTILSLMSKIPLVGNSVKGAAKAVEQFSDTGLVPMLDDKLRTGLGGIFGPGTTGPAKDKAKDAGKDIGGDLGDGINAGAGDAADGESWVKSWVESVYSAMEKEISRVRDSAVAAMEKAHKAALQTYDDRIKAIEDQEKAEKKLYATEEYLASKRDLLAKRNLDNQNYQKNRALAIYEGRYNDARMLDVQERVSKQDYNKDLTKLEEDRSKDLLQESRDLAKDQIKIEKEAAEERFRLLKEIFEAFLDQILEYKPATVGEFQSMLDQINGLLGNVGITWPEYATGAMERFQSVFEKANREIVEDFKKSGKDSITAWMEGAISPEAKAIILAGLNTSGGGGGGGGGVSAGGGEEGGGEPAQSPEEQAKEDAKTSFEEQQKKYKNARTIFDKDFHKDKKSAFAFGTDAFKTKAEATDTRDISAKTKEEQALIDMIKQQIKVGDTRNQGLEEYSKAMAQLKADAYDYYHTISDEEAKAREQVVESMKTQLLSKNATYLKNQQAVESIKKTTDSVKVFIDESGVMWNEVNGEMVDSYGRTAKAVRDENGNMTGSLLMNNGKIIKGTEQTFTSAQDLLKQMEEKGIKPGTAAAQDYVKKINDLGYAVYTLPSGKTIVIDADTSKLYEAIKRVNKFFQENNKSGGGYVPLDFVDLIAQTGSVQGAIDYTAGPNLSFLNDPGIRAALGLPRLASGGLVKAQKDGVIANIGEGGFDEYVITTDPKYRASNLGYLAAAASKLGVKMASGAAVKAASGGMFTSSGVGGSSAEYAAGMGGDVYINVDTFIGEEQWFAEMANKYNMKTVPRQRKIEGQQKRVVSSYNDRYRLR